MKFALVGYGKMGRFYDQLLPASYLVDVVPHAGRICFGNVEEFIAYRQPVDLVICASPTNFHYKIAGALLKAGYNVLVEKPICISSIEARELENVARGRSLILYQSTLERYNPLVKFINQNIEPCEIERVVSYRFGLKPPRLSLEDPKFDLGIHDVDLWVHLFKRQIPWQVNVGYGKPRREIWLTMKNGKVIKLDLMHKFIILNGHSLDFSKASSNNPILEMVYDLMYKGRAMNERWSEEIKILEEASGSPIELGC